MEKAIAERGEKRDERKEKREKRKGNSETAVLSGAPLFLFSLVSFLSLLISLL